jgi:putative ABC transport system ATP-binding protein
MIYALETKQVTKIYGEGNDTVAAVSEVDIDVKPGEFVALVGPSGSGKTTMLAMLAGLLSPTEGSIRIGGMEIGKLSEKELTKFRREKVGFTFQANNLVPYLNALENVELMLKLNGKLDEKGRKQARELLERLGLGDRLKNMPNQLSGGQQQRVAIARSLVHNPRLVLADEPTASLDTERAYQVVNTFAGLIHEQKRAGIMVTHDLRMVQYVDKVIRMVDGSVAELITDKGMIAHLAGSQIMEEAGYPVKKSNGKVHISTPVQQPFMVSAGYAD